ncbi:beta-barrel assembly-enhancing protease [Halodesulfovibrio marinisediminis]|uniref:Putative Zn-dependent protease, contains TPR repeats n=1 Tax=Halodesulfovibrio marinisediminis DSM 17456 TaxID=1121457 RepID=A0A1N6E392_9BACT|nr:M48 family metallopeptidase [Halodesulfovibrio marinisediminis]SIN77453.1 Putative Zn-dependent protease, contains TPR repeats [Halodesulfovibrio marinisediminis DSM 17456]
MGCNLTMKKALQHYHTTNNAPFWKNLLCALVAVLIVALPPVQLAKANILDTFGKFGVKEEAELGKKFSILVKSRMPIIEDPEIVSYVEGVLDRLQEHIPPQPFPFEVNVIVDDTLNAFAVPGGYVFVHTGMLLEMEHESELAGVLAHELAHITQRHIAKRIEKSQKVQLISLVGMLAGAVLGATTESGSNVTGGLITGSMAAGQAALLNYSRDDEREADHMGLIYLTEAGYNPKGLANSFAKIRKRKWQSGSNMPTYLSTHPAVEERQDYLADRVASLPKDLQDRPENDTKFKRVQTLVRSQFTDPATALTYFAKQEQTPLILMGQGIAAARINKVKQAADFFERAVEGAPKDYLVLREAGKFHYTKGDTNKAIFLLQKAAVRNPDDLMTLFYYARLLNDKGDSKTAATYYQKILQVLPEDSEVHFFYGKMLGQSGDEFNGHLHLAYSALYRNDAKKTAYHMKKAKAVATNEKQTAALELLKKQRDERAAYWE